ncbi:MAG: GNAT family N-acetyltransferase [Spirochaetales bacterium]|nr:GNAT family N-acetyltransferase [Spirochaetales bacterium]
MIRIVAFQARHWDSVWRVLEPVFRAGETYAFSPDITQEEARRLWIDVPARTFVAAEDAKTGEVVLGTYYLKPNQPSLGAHVCNCGYVVAQHARGRGIASAMCEHSQAEARGMGFRAMQYNLVVVSNEGAVRLWKKHGFTVVGVLPGAFRHPRLGYVDALVMFKQLLNG